MGNEDRRSSVAWMIVILLMLVVPSACGDDALAVAVGARVRAYVAKVPAGADATDSKMVTGALLALSETTITIEVSKAEQRAPLVLERQRVTKLDLSLRRSRRKRGALIGLGVGMAAGIAIGLASGSDGPGCWICMSATEKGAASSLLLAPIGAGIGAAVSPGERWQPVAPDRIRLGPGGTPSARVAMAWALRLQKAPGATAAWGPQLVVRF